jgi:hypothetical protein
MAMTNIALRIVLAIIGTIVVLLGINLGLGGIRTLGLQGGTDFLTVTDPALYAIRDSHSRFIGGVWLAAGLVLLAGSVALDRLRPVLIVLTGMVFVGGLARFSAFDLALLTNMNIAPSLLFELVGFPLLGWWIAKSGRARS